MAAGGEAALEAPLGLVAAVGEHQVPAGGKKAGERGDELGAQALVVTGKLGLDPGPDGGRRTPREVPHAEVRRLVLAGGENGDALLGKPSGSFGEKAKRATRRLQPSEGLDHDPEPGWRQMFDYRCVCRAHQGFTTCPGLQPTVG